MSKALYLKWRPHLWEQVVSQEHIIHTLQNAIRSDRVGHAYLFAGPRGTGKTTTARLLAKAVNCETPNLADRPCDQCKPCQAVNKGSFLDLIEIDAASNTSVDDVRDLRDKINFSPSQGRYKVYIIDEVHMLSNAAFNALLKTLEEPPPHAIFILATTAIHKIPATVLSRCQRHEFRRIPTSDIIAQLKKISEKEGLLVEESALSLIARQSTGSLRDAISLLDLLSSTGEHITLTATQTVLGTATNQLVVELVNALLDSQHADGLNCIQQALDGGIDPQQFARQLVNYLRSVLLIQFENKEQVDTIPEMLSLMSEHARVFKTTHLMTTLRLFNKAASEKTRSGWQQPSLHLELAFAEAVEHKQIQSDTIPQKKAAIARMRTNSTSTPTISPGISTVNKTDQISPSEKIKQPDSQREIESQPIARAPADTSKVTQVQTGDKGSQFPIQQESTSSSISLQDINRSWDRIKEYVKRSRPQTVALLNSCKPLTVKNGVLFLGFASEIVKSKMEMNDNIELTCQAISQVTGSKVSIACEIMSKKANVAPADLNINGDGLVGTALNLGGKIVTPRE